MSLTNAMMGELPKTVNPDAISMMDKLNGMEVPQSRESFAEEVYRALEKDFQGDALSKELQRLRLSTTEELLSSVDAYIALRKKYPGIAFHNEFMQRSGSEVTDTALFIIDNVVKKARITDRFDIMSEVCTVLENKFGCGDKLEANLNKMNLRTTEDILHAIDLYFVMCRLYPDTVFGRERMQKVWADAV